MEKDVKLGSVGDVDAQASLAGESVKGSVALGPIKVALSAQLSNRDALDYLAKQVPGGWEHDAIIALEKVLFPDAVAAALSQPSA